VPDEDCCDRCANHQPNAGPPDSCPRTRVSSTATHVLSRGAAASVSNVVIGRQRGYRCGVRGIMTCVVRYVHPRGELADIVSPSWLMWLHRSPTVSASFDSGAYTHRGAPITTASYGCSSIIAIPPLCRPTTGRSSGGTSVVTRVAGSYTPLTAVSGTSSTRMMSACAKIGPTWSPRRRYTVSGTEMSAR